MTISLFPKRREIQWQDFTCALFFVPHAYISE